MLCRSVTHPLPKRAIAALLLAGTILAGCGHVPIMSIPALAAIDFRTTQFQALRAAIEMPEALLPQPGGVRLNVRLSIGGAVTEQRSYALVQTTTTQGDQTHGIVPEEGRHAFIYQLTDEDQMGMNAIRRAIVAAEQAGQSGSLRLTVGVEDICARAPLVDGRLLIDVFLKSSETGRFVRTLDGYDIRELGAADVGLEANLRPCI